MASSEPIRSTLAAMVAAQAGQSTVVAPAAAATRPSLVPAKLPVPQPSQQSSRQPQILPSGELSPTELFAKVRQASTKLRQSLVEIAYYGYRLKQRDAWDELGFDCEDDARQDLGLAGKLWETYMILGERLADLTLDQMSAIPVDTARLLTRIHPNVWAEYAWLDEARTLPFHKFVVLVNERNSQAVPKSLREPQVKLNIQVPATQKQRLDDRVRQLKQQRQLPSIGQALEFALDAADREVKLQQELVDLQQQVAALAQLWPQNQPWSTDLREGEPERLERFATGDSTVAAAASETQILTGKIRSTLEAINAVYAQKVSSSTR